MSGVQFTVPEVNDGRPFSMDFENALDRVLVGEFLGRISERSWRDGFMISALVVHKDSGSGGQPAESFFKWMLQLGLIPNLNPYTKMTFWLDQVNKAFAFYSHP